MWRPNTTARWNNSKWNAVVCDDNNRRAKQSGQPANMQSIIFKPTEQTHQSQSQTAS
eukprot:m.361575 g.361575  ORF g.361575 m.361575 type:complete len:57 (-) comp19687_c0_seq1:2555-2725(-)